MNILIIGSGGREHSLAWKLNQSKKVDEIFIAPGNAGTAELGTNLAIEVNDFEKIKEIVLRLKMFEPIQYILGETEFHGLKLG